MWGNNVSRRIFRRKEALRIFTSEALLLRILQKVPEAAISQSKAEEDGAGRRRKNNRTKTKMSGKPRTPTSPVLSPPVLRGAGGGVRNFAGNGNRTKSAVMNLRDRFERVTEAEKIMQEMEDISRLEKVENAKIKNAEVEEAEAARRRYFFENMGFSLRKLRGIVPFQELWREEEVQGGVHRL